MNAFMALIWTLDFPLLSFSKKEACAAISNKHTDGHWLDAQRFRILFSSFTVSFNTVQKHRVWFIEILFYWSKRTRLKASQNIFERNNWTIDAENFGFSWFLWFFHYDERMLRLVDRFLSLEHFENMPTQLPCSVQLWLCEAVLWMQWEYWCSSVDNQYVLLSTTNFHSKMTFFPPQKHYKATIVLLWRVQKNCRFFHELYFVRRSQLHNCTIPWYFRDLRK